MATEHYRVLDAEYVIIGANADLGNLAKETVNSLRSTGLRAGAVLLPDLGSISSDVLHLLAQSMAVGVVECGTTRSQIADWLSTQFGQAAYEHDWPAWSFVPRVYSAVPVNARVRLQSRHLEEFVKAMREYAPDRLVLLPNGLIKPTLSVNDPAAKVSASESKADRKASFASVA
ncbi:MAG: hypothetical protein ABL995_19385 [Bryobacteraceae bacterium]